MEKKFVIENIAEAVNNKLQPTVTMWNRQEGRPRADDFKRALKAEVRDALWMLTRQWQMGEFEGDDAGSPILSKVYIETSGLNQYAPSDRGFREMDDSLPLEATVERKSIPMNAKGHLIRIDLRLQMGRFWIKLLGESGLTSYASAFKLKYAFLLPTPDAHESDFVYSHAETWQQYSAIAGRAMDGYELYSYLGSDSFHAASDNITLSNPADKTVLDGLGNEFIAWYKRLYVQPSNEDNAWEPGYLEYQFSCAVNQSQKTNEAFVAKEYYSDTPDWYVFDRGANRIDPGSDPKQNDKTFLYTFLPSHVEFDGMPDTRWWSFEDGKTNFGNVKPNTTDLAKLLLLEFGLVYSNDWFIIPFRLPINSTARIGGFTVTNTFGEKTWILQSGSGQNQDWHKWQMFTLSPETGNESIQSPSLILPALTVKTQKSEPIEEINFIRDEMSNMVWAIETTVPSVNGYGRGGKEAAQEVLAYHKNLVAESGITPPEYPYAAKVSYQAMTEVPGHWIPFVPVHSDGTNREIQLQRSRMLRIIEGDSRPPEKIEPETSLLREGLDTQIKEPYFIHEEEILRSGIKVSERFQRTRWTRGEVITWLSVDKQTGRGEGSSGLAFDQLTDMKNE
jgi:hypothetical protein